MTQKTAIKQNIKFLTNPTWTPARKDVAGVLLSPYGVSVQQSGQYGMRRLPNTKDKQVLIALLSLLPAGSRTVTLQGIRKFKQTLGGKGGVSNGELDRLLEAINVWMDVRIEGDIRYTTESGEQREEQFTINGVFTSVHYKRAMNRNDDERSFIKIKFNEEFLEELQKPMFVLTDVEHYKQIKGGLALRLYEILSANLYRRKMHGIPLDTFKGLVGKDFADSGDMQRQMKKALEEIHKATGIRYQYTIDESPKRPGLRNKGRWILFSRN